ncbi:glycine betaine ABC transporter substrate-binding protein, partial [Phytoactinopolyspora endophytica]|uniref:glycine betaine ABC transporter substrate-binding protein n=1 Tax=Phytoactinopolyspora endophytica TaxID=1642495 RepID=UPI00197C74C7
MGRPRRTARLAAASRIVAVAVTATTMALTVAVPSGARPAVATTPTSDEGTVRMARATWDTGWFQAEVYRQLIETLGYRVETVTTMENADFYRAAAAGEVDLWANGWFPLHDTIIDDVGARDRLET